MTGATTGAAGVLGGRPVQRPAAPGVPVRARVQPRTPPNVNDGPNVPAARGTLDDAALRGGAAGLTPAAA